MTKTFEATNRKTNRTITIEASDIYTAANIAAKQFTRRKTVYGSRVTGEGSLSGMFGVYQLDKRFNCAVHQGLEFHLSEVASGK